jgi:outer membrane protein TolC
MILMLGAVLGAGWAMAQDSPAWEPSQPLTLAQAVERTLQAHPEVRSALASVQRAQAAAVVGRSRQWPQLSADWAVRESQSLSRPVNVGGAVVQASGARQTQRDAELSLSYTVYETGLADSVKRLQVLAAASQAGLPDVHRVLTYEVRSAYYTALAGWRRATVALKSLAAAERHRELVQARIEAGSAPRSDLLPIEVEVARARLDSVRAETALQVAHATLRALLVLPPETPLELADALPEGTLQPEVGAWLEVAEKSRPDLQAQRLNVRASELGKKVAEDGRGVQLSATAAGDWGRHTGTTGETWQLRLGASYPLFDAGAARAQAQSARAEETMARERLESLRLDLQVEVESACRQLRQAAAAIEAASAARTSAADSLRAAEIRYREGLAIIIEVTDAQVSLSQAEVEEVQTRYDYALALAALSRAVGAEVTPAAGETR